MKPLFAAALICAFFSMPAFSAVNNTNNNTSAAAAWAVPGNFSNMGTPLSVRAPLTVNWPITGTYNGQAYTINGGGNVPTTLVTLGTSHSFSPYMGGTYTTGTFVLPGSTITRATIGIYTNMEGYELSFGSLL